MSTSIIAGAATAIRRTPGAVCGFAERRAVPSTIRGRQPSRTSGHDVYAGKDGSVYDRRNNSWYRQNGQGWNRVKRPAPDVNREQQSRSFGATRPNTIGCPAAGGGVFRGGGFPAGGCFHGGAGVHGGRGRR